MKKYKLCPYCGEIMDIGYVYNGKDDLVWTPEDVTPSGWINFPNKYEIMLSRSKRVVSNKLLVHHCSSCGVFFIYNDELEKHESFLSKIKKKLHE